MRSHAELIVLWVTIRLRLWCIPTSANMMIHCIFLSTVQKEPQNNQACSENLHPCHPQPPYWNSPPPSLHSLLAHFAEQQACMQFTSRHEFSKSYSRAFIWYTFRKWVQKCVVFENGCKSVGGWEVGGGGGAKVRSGKHHF